MLASQAQRHARVFAPGFVGFDFLCETESNSEVWDTGSQGDPWQTE